MVRIAQTVDISSITSFAQEYKERKKLFEDSEFKERDFKQFLFECVNSKECKVFISTKDDDVHGFLIMSVDRVPWNKNKKWASDVLFAAERDAATLLKHGIVWAKAHNCWKIFFSNSTGYEQADKFFELMGLRKVGGQYEYVL